jgi:hypothetical protein
VYQKRHRLSIRGWHLTSSIYRQEEPIVYFIFNNNYFFPAAAQINIFLSADRLNIYRLIAIEGYERD